MPNLCLNDRSSDRHKYMTIAHPDSSGREAQSQPGGEIARASAGFQLGQGWRKSGREEVLPGALLFGIRSPNTGIRAQKVVKKFGPNTGIRGWNRGDISSGHYFFLFCHRSCRKGRGKYPSGSKCPVPWLQPGSRLLQAACSRAWCRCLLQALGGWGPAPASTARSATRTVRGTE